MEEATDAPIRCHPRASSRLTFRPRPCPCHANLLLIPSCRCYMSIDHPIAHTSSIYVLGRSDVQLRLCMSRALKSFLRSMFAWCMCDRRANDAGENSPGFDAELKEVPNEARPRGDVRLVTPRGPSASTIESLEKALQTVEIERAFQSVRLFETFYSSEINLLARAIETVHFNDKECIYRQGDPGDYYYLILKGRVNCQMQSSATSQNVTFREICTGQFFGEAALLSAKPRAATMVANGPCTLGRLSRERLASVIGNIVDILSRDAAVLKRYEPNLRDAGLWVEESSASVAPLSVTTN